MSANDTTGVVLARWDDWLADVTDRLMDLDARSASGTDQLRLDLAAAFVCRKAVAERVAAMHAEPSRSAALAEQPLVDGQGSSIAADLAGAAALLAAVLDRVETTLGASEAVAGRIAADSVSAAADLDVAERLSTDLGEHVQRVAAIRSELHAAGRQAGALRDAAAAAASVRADLEASAAQRDELLRRWPTVGATLDRLRRREADVQVVVARCREKVRPVPTLAVPSVAALADAPSLDELLAQPWPAARAVMRQQLDRLDRLAAAFDEIEHRYAAPLERRDELRGLLQSYRDKAGGSGLAEHPDLEPRYRAAEAELWSAPCDVERGLTLVDEYCRAVNDMIAAASRPARDRGAR
ncbi:MAG: hypothetical protein HZB15_08095 [Actinobacteria bacterium]|nr:hypothetical protein [Actinomycetota bacterium]